MCGRFALTTPASRIAEIFELDILPDWTPRYNIAPTDPVAALLEDGGNRRLELFRWGLIPSWAKDRKIGARMINARGETVASKPAFRTSFERRRVLVLADGFYEWTRAGKRKLPHLIGLHDGEVFGMAGLWSFWRDPHTGEGIRSCTVLTTKPNTLLAPIHDRMPVIVDRADWTRWLAPSTSPGDLQALIRPFDAARMTSRRVPTTVNSVRNEGPELHAPLSGDEA